MKTIAILIVALIACYFFVVKRRSTTGNQGTLGLNGANALKKSQKKSIAPRNPWRATSIVHDEKACEAVKAIGGKRFLDTDRNIPKLPLPTCNVTRCKCKYVRHEDRRNVTEDRRHPNALQAELYDRSGEANRRARKRGRRKTDWV